MIAGGDEQLVLLTGSDEGYFISAVRLKMLRPEFSRAEDGDYKIGEGKVRQERRFRSLEELWEMLAEKVA